MRKYNYSISYLKYIFIFFAAVFGIYYVFLFKSANDVRSEQSLNTELVLARSQASSLTSFLQDFGNSIAAMAGLSSMEEMDDTVVQDLTSFIDRWEHTDIIGGIAVTDAKGDVRFNANVIKTKDVGVSLSDRDYYKWAVNQRGEQGYFIGKAVVGRGKATDGQIIVPVASPIYKDSEVVGVLVASVKAKPLIQRYLNMMKISDLSRTFLIGSTGELLFTDSNAGEANPKLIEFNKDSTFSGDQKLFEKISGALKNGGEGSLETSLLDTSSGKMKPHLFAYSSVDLGNRKWLFVMADPVKFGATSDSSIHVQQISVLLLISLFLLLAGIIATKENAFQKRL